MMSYLITRNGRFYYNRRVPAILKKHDSRCFVRFALNTDSRKEAMRLAFVQNEQIENYWKKLIEANSRHTEETYNEIIFAAKLFAFKQPNSIIEIAKPDPNDKSVGAFKTENIKTSILLDEALERFWHFAKDRLINKSENQIRKWRNPRKRAIKNLINCIGNKTLTEINRDDIITFRDLWLSRIENENLVENSANKDFIHLKTIFETVSDNLKLNLDIKHLFNKLLLEESNGSEKLPFTTEHIVSTLLVPENLSGLNVQARSILCAMSETGAGLTELVNLNPDDILLGAEIPHILITPRKKNGLKTRYRKRAIPLVGFALDAFKECPEGFPAYRDRPDALSSTMNKYLREHNLLPTDNHTVNSLRHSFQDRLLAVNAPDRVQADLMGHKFNRPMYGEGASLQNKQEWLQKIKLKIEVS